VAAWSLSDDENARLVSRVRDGDHEAFTRFYEAMRGDVYNLAARILSDRDAAADVTQDVFLAAFRQLPGETEDLRLEPWLYRVTVNRCYDHLRRLKRRQTQPVAEIDDQIAAGDELERAELAAAIEEALERLNPRQRAVLVLNDLHGLDTREAAYALGVSQGTARVSLFRARAAFQRAFREISPATPAVMGLGMLPALPVPASLGAAPFAAPLTSSALPDPSGAASLAHSLLPTAASAPLIAGLSKIGSAVGAKVVLALAGAAMLAGGGVAVEQAVDRPADPEPRLQTVAVTSAIVPQQPAGLADPLTGSGVPWLHGRTAKGSQSGPAAAGHGAQNGGPRRGTASGNGGAESGSRGGAYGSGSGSGSAGGSGSAAGSGYGSSGAGSAGRGGSAQAGSATGDSGASTSSKGTAGDSGSGAGAGQVAHPAGGLTGNGNGSGGAGAAAPMNETAPDSGAGMGPGGGPD
jgi:RNA polymerase sigma-70 factor, ECF subfamily